jgi:hypothetical protein
VKKSIFVLAALSVAIHINAQLTYEGTQHVIRLGMGTQRIIAQNIDSNSSEQDAMLVGDYFMTTDMGLSDGHTHYNVYNANMTLVKSFLIEGSFFGVPIGSSSNGLYVWNYISKGIFTTNGKWTCLVTEYKKENLKDGNGTILGEVKKVKELRLVDEDGTILSIIPYTGDTKQTSLSLVKIGDTYKLFVPTGDDTSAVPYAYDIYSLPGNGEATDVSEIPAPRHDARKYLHNDQVLIDSNDKTYTLQGQEVK